MQMNVLINLQSRGYRVDVWHNLVGLSKSNDISVATKPKRNFSNLTLRIERESVQLIIRRLRQLVVTKVRYIVGIKKRLINEYQRRLPIIPILIFWE